MKATSDTHHAPSRDPSSTSFLNPLICSDTVASSFTYCIVLYCTALYYQNWQKGGGDMPSKFEFDILNMNFWVSETGNA